MGFIQARACCVWLAGSLRGFFAARRGLAPVSYVLSQVLFQRQLCGRCMPPSRELRMYATADGSCAHACTVIYSTAHQRGRDTIEAHSHTCTTIISQGSRCVVHHVHVVFPTQSAFRTNVATAAGRDEAYAASERVDDSAINLPDRIIHIVRAACDRGMRARAVNNVALQAFKFSAATCTCSQFETSSSAQPARARQPCARIASGPRQAADMAVSW